jgi:anti-sigma-K factor RskA
MTRLSCADVEPLLAARALDTLPADEAKRIDEHLRACPEQAAALLELRRTAAVLPLAVDDREPPAQLRDRIMEAVGRESPGPVATGAAVARPAEAASYRRGAARWRRLPDRLMLVAAVLVALGLGYAAGLWFGQPRAQTWSFAGNQQAPSAEATLVYLPSQQSGVLTATGLPSLAAGQVYEAWLIQNGKPVGIGTSRVDGKMVLHISRNVSQYQVLAITIEPREEAAPTTTPVLAGHLT